MSGRSALALAAVVLVGTLPAATAEARRDGSSTPPGRIVHSRALEGGGRALFVARADGSGAVQVTNGPADFSPQWSPDGRRIAFVRLAGENATEIWVANADGTGARALDTDHRYAEHPRWSPNGRWIAYQVQTSTHLRTGARAHTTFELWLVRPDGSERRRLVRGDGEVVNDNPLYHVAIGAWAWSPDGRSIAYVSEGVRVVDIVSGRTRLLGAGHDVAWSPDGRRLAVTVDTAFEIGVRECGVVWIVPRDGGKRRLVRPPRGACDRRARWSPDGRSIVFARSAPESTRSRLLAATPAGRDLRPVLPLAAARHAWPPRCTRLFEYEGGWIVRSGPRAALRFVRFPVGASSRCDTDAVEPCALAGDWRC